MSVSLCSQRTVALRAEGGQHLKKPQNTAKATAQSSGDSESHNSRYCILNIKLPYAQVLTLMCIAAPSVRPPDCHAEPPNPRAETEFCALIYFTEGLLVI